MSATNTASFPQSTDATDSVAARERSDRFAESRAQTFVGDVCVEEWFYDRYQATRVHANRWFVVAMLFGALACFAVAAIVMLVPLKSIQPFLVEVNTSNGEVRVLRPAATEHIAANEPITKSFLAKYVIARETYDPQDLKQNYQLVRMMSDPKEGLRVDSWLDTTNSSSPINRYQSHTVRSVRVKSVSLLNSRTAQVRFISTETQQTTKREESWVAIVSFRFVSVPETEEDRLVNPLGFQVMAYRVDQELVQ